MSSQVGDRGPSKAKAICHVTSTHSVTDARITFRECSTLINDGHCVTLVAPGGDVDKSPVQGVKVLGPTWPGSRLERLLVTGPKVAWSALREQADLYQFHDAELLPFALLFKVLGRSVVYDVHEDIPRDVEMVGWLPDVLKPAVSTVLEGLENGIARFLDGLVVATKSLECRFRGIAADVALVRNFPLLDFWPMSGGDCGDDKEPFVCYTGGIAERTGVMPMLEAVAECEVTLVVAGRFADEGIRNRCLAHRGWSYVDYRGEVPVTEVPEIVRGATAGLAVYPPFRSYRESLPVKMFEYMAAGVAVITSNFSRFRKIIEENGCGICVDPRNSREFADAVEYLAENPGIAATMGIRGRRSAEQEFNWNNEQDRLLGFYERITLRVDSD